MWHLPERPPESFVELFTLRSVTQKQLLTFSTALPPPTSMHYIWISELSHTWTCTCTHTNTQSQIWSWRSRQCFPLAFLRGKTFCRRDFWWQILLLKIFQAKQTEQQWAYHARILQRTRSATNCEGGLFAYLCGSRHFDLFETVSFMMLGRHVTVARRAS